MLRQIICLPFANWRSSPVLRFANVRHFINLRLAIELLFWISTNRKCQGAPFKRALRFQRSASYQGQNVENSEVSERRSGL